MKNLGVIYLNKVRIYELAKELGIQSKELVTIAQGLKIDVHNHMSTLEVDDIAAIKDYMNRKNKRQEPEKKAVAAENKQSKPEAPKAEEKTEEPKQKKQVPMPAQPKPQQNKQAEQPQGRKPEQKQVQKPQKPEQRIEHKQDNRPAAKSSKPVHSAGQHPSKGWGTEKTHLSTVSHLEIDEDVVPIGTKKEFAKVEKIGKKPQGKAIQGKPSHKPHHGKPGSKNLKHKEQEEHVKPDAHLPKKPIKIGDSISVKELSEKLGKQATEIIKKLLLLGVMATINKELDFDTAQIICEEFGVTVEKLVDKESEEVLLKTEEDRPEDLRPRPPVVTIMGHVDHGKTSLLDAIRETNVIATEAGGITQHIGAYTVTIGDKKIAFLDTPGHEAFTAMRARGAKVTDIAVLVVAADDGVMPQTVEAINHAKAANVAIIVAINKIDKSGANPDRVKQELTEYGLIAEDWGGDTVMVPVSAKKKIGIDNLLEMILLVAEMLELKANPNKKATGTVIEAELDKGRGPVATLLIQDGSLNVGDYFIVGNTYGKVRAMMDDKGKRLKKAGPSTPVEIQGLNEVPDAGDIFIVVDDEKVAKTIAEKRKEKQRLAQLQSKQKISLDELFSQIQEGKVKELNIIVKADVQGSVEAIKQSLTRLSNEEVKVNTIHGGVGAITESDVMLASASNAIIIGFNVRPQPAAIALAERDKVDIRLYRVIYNAIEDVEAAMKGMLEPEYKEVVLGHAEVRATFKASSVGTIAGCYITDGKINRNNDVRVIRDGIVIHEGKLASLKRFKDDVKEVTAGYECGLNIEKFNDIKEGDIIEAFTIEAVPRK